MVRGRAWVVGFAVLASAGTSSGAESVDAPLPLVSNPVAEAWAGHKPGAWARYKLWITDPARGELELEPHNEPIMALLQTTEHEIVLKRGMELVSGGQRSLRWQNSDRDRIERWDDRTGPLGYRFQDRAVEVVEGREPRAVAGKRLFCTTWQASDYDGHTIKVWFHPSIPGGLVRLERGLRTEGGAFKVDQAEEVYASGAAPDGSFAWPPPPEDPKEAWEEQETYVGWAQHPIGAWVHTTNTSKVMGRTPEAYDRVFTLLESRPTRVDISLGWFGDRRAWRSTYRWQRPLPRLEDGKVTEDTVSGPETLVVNGTSLSCKVRKRVWTSPFATETVTEWLNPTVPGGIVQRVTLDKPGNAPREERMVVTAFGVREVKADPLAATRQSTARLTTPPALVANPVAEAWASQKPGAWVRSQEYAFDPRTRRLVPTTQCIRILVQVNADDVVLQERREEPVGTKKAWIWVFDQSHRLDRKAEALGAFHPAFTPWQDVPVVEGKEKLTVAGKGMDCLTLDAQEATGLKRRFKLTLAPGVPGGVVREEWYGKVGGTEQELWRAYEAVAWGSKPDGKFPWPIPAKGTKPWVEQEEYRRWAKTPVGSWIRQKSVLVPHRGGDPARIETRRLLEVRPTRAIVEMADGSSIHVLSEQRWKLPPDEPGRFKEEELKPERATETLTVGGKPLECTVRKRRLTTSAGASEVMEWLNPSVPGGVVQTVTKDTLGGQEYTLTVTVEEFGGPP